MGRQVPRHLSRNWRWCFAAGTRGKTGRWRPAGPAASPHQSVREQRRRETQIYSSVPQEPEAKACVAFRMMDENKNDKITLMELTLKLLYDKRWKLLETKCARAPQNERKWKKIIICTLNLSIVGFPFYRFFSKWNTDPRNIQAKINTGLTLINYELSFDCVKVVRCVEVIIIRYKEW